MGENWKSNVHTHTHVCACMYVCMCALEEFLGRMAYNFLKYLCVLVCLQQCVVHAHVCFYLVFV